MMQILIKILELLEIVTTNTLTQLNSTKEPIVKVMVQRSIPSWRPQQIAPLNFGISEYPNLLLYVSLQTVTKIDHNK